MAEVDTESKEYWKQRSESWENQYYESQKLFDELEIFSRELEEELKRELVAKSKALEETKHRESKLQESLRYKAGFEEEQGLRIFSLQKEVQQARSTIDKLTEANRTLEQSNDNFERRDRENMALIDDISIKYENAFEQLVILREEYNEDKAQSSEIIQRLKDELRDLQSELNALQKRHSSSESDKGSNDKNDHSSPKPPADNSITKPTLTDIPMSPVTPVYKRQKLPTPIALATQELHFDEPETDLLSDVPIEQSRKTLNRLKSAGNILQDILRLTQN